ncbi:MAG: hypothetical protein ABFR47_04055 [Verrucomicrobiota bacterium]
MSFPRVNLLKRSERRYQGVVSRKFMQVGIVVSSILFLSLFVGLRLVQYAGLQSNLRGSRIVWESLEPRLAVAKEQQRVLATNRQVLELLDAWRKSQVPMEGLLLDIQEAIPENVQLMRISLRSNAKNSIARNADELKLGYSLTLQGVSQGEQAENAVINLRKGLQERDHLSTFFDSLKLVSMRKRQGRSGENMREFSFEGLAAEDGRNQ